MRYAVLARLLAVSLAKGEVQMIGLIEAGFEGPYPVDPGPELLKEVFAVAGRSGGLPACLGAARRAKPGQGSRF